MASHRFRNDAPTTNVDDLGVPPGFLSRTSFALRRLEDEQCSSPIELNGLSLPDLLNDADKFMDMITRTPFSCQEQLNPSEKSKQDPVYTSTTKKAIRELQSSDDSMEVNLSKIDDVPVFHPSEEEFKDTLKYVASIRPVAERYGICRIVPPPSWKPPCLLEGKLTWEAEPVSLESTYDYGSKFTMKSFRRYADDFKRQYFSKSCKLTKNGNETYSIEQIEAEYWRLVGNADEEIKEALRSPFPIKVSPAEDSLEYTDYLASGWNLSSIAKCPGSLLPFGCYRNTSTICAPKCFLGMCFTSRFWKNEEHHLYSLSYLHLGEPKVWYCVPGRYCFKFIDVLRRFTKMSKHPEFLHQLAIQISPSLLTSEGIPVYKCVQQQSEFILVFPGAYRNEISCGLNLSEASCFAPFDWLPHGQNIIEHYSEYALKPSISHDKLLVQTAIKAVTAEWESMTRKNISSATKIWRNHIGKNTLLTKLLKCRVKNEGIRRKHINHCLDNKAFDDDFAAPVRRDCSICFYDLYLSAVWCSCSPNKYFCLRHSKRICSCAWIVKHFVFRYTMPELELLVQAVEGNLSAVYKWVKKKNVSNSGSSKTMITDQNETLVIVSDGED